MSRLFFIFILITPILSQGTDELIGAPTESSVCSNAYDGCVSQCSSAVFTGLRYRFHTNVKRKCKQACEAGKNSCDVAAELDKCNEFEFNCQEKCPSSIFDRRNNKYIFVSTAKRQCKETCTAGADICKIN